MKRANNKVIVITGGTTGIGKGIAKKFLDEGANVVICGRSEKSLQTAKEALPNDNLITIQVDVSKTDDLKRLYSETVERFGKIDVLVACAGVAKQLHIKDATEEDFDYVVDINYRGLFFTVKYALDYLKDGASIVLISSIAAFATLGNHSIYSSSKAAVSKLAQNFAFDLAQRNIRVNSISPGYIETPIFDSRIAKEPDYLESRSQYIPLKRIGKPEDIANAALFFSSDEASYITGADLVVDGGFTTSYPLPD